ncbi:hypothetical protein [Haloarcula terrestris]|uniref:hypothetical protein n=1 Tax=Haloarcula terrestris TaxID=2950533 RepID=UPI00287BC83C|nr:hypothetical protein [Haloarcula terrestris]
MKNIDTLQEAITQIQFAQQELEDDNVSQDLEEAIKPLQELVESLEKEAENQYWPNRMRSLYGLY